MLNWTYAILLGKLFNELPLIGRNGLIGLIVRGKYSRLKKIFVSCKLKVLYGNKLYYWPPNHKVQCPVKTFETTNVKYVAPNKLVSHIKNSFELSYFRRHYTIAWRRSPRMFKNDKTASIVIQLPFFPVNKIFLKQQHSDQYTMKK